ncbi:hypothetical protein GOV03_05020 [Candidatus Woesearchaeota archaeon]|nr:hypothetical protein [Candidatus Woesearchaeota archaeon]
MENLESEVQKPNWKQWLPLYGVKQILKDDEAGKPLIIGKEEHSVRYCATGLYHSLFVMPLTLGVLASAAYGINGLVENLF